MSSPIIDPGWVSKAIYKIYLYFLDYRFCFLFVNFFAQDIRKQFCGSLWKIDMLSCFNVSLYINLCWTTLLSINEDVISTCCSLWCQSLKDLFPNLCCCSTGGISFIQVSNSFSILIIPLTTFSSGSSESLTSRIFFPLIASPIAKMNPRYS